MSSKAEECVARCRFVIKHACAHRYSILLVPLISFQFALLKIVKTRRVRRRQAASLQEQATVLAEKRQRQEEAALLERQEIIGHYKHSVLGDKSAYVDV